MGGCNFGKNVPIIRSKINNRSKMREKITIKKRGGRRTIIKIRYLIVAVGLLAVAILPRSVATAEGCPDLRVVFARGSGGEQWTDKNYLEFKTTIEQKLAGTGVKYEFIDLEYPAVGIGLDKLGVTAGAFFGSGEAYEFGESVDTGVGNLTRLVNGASCPGTKYVLGGYSQGAMVVSKALKSLRAERIIYAATFGDPKLYLPEGAGLVPAACRGENLSDYRMYVPDCRAYKGMLGAYIPYEPTSFAGKVGVWCNNKDIMCSSRHYNFGNVADHTSYVKDGLYEDASRVVFDKVAKSFGLENHISSPHDTAILIDSSGSMANMIEEYKAEALRLARETFESGGRVALYDYRDLDDPYTPVERCNFETCTLETFTTGLAKIQVDGGGDEPESLLSASFHVMRSLNWKKGSTKSLVILTDADFLAPDRDGMTFDEVVALSKRIDPVNFYIITNAATGDKYAALATATDGKVVTNFDELTLLTDYIMERYDSLPRVEEEAGAVEIPGLEVEEVSVSSDQATVRFKTTGVKVLVALNDAVLGVIEGSEVTVAGLDPAVQNVLTLVPLGEEVRGEAVEVPLENEKGGRGAVSSEILKSEILKAPSTGRR